MANNWVPLNSIFQRSQIIEDTVELYLPAREINLKACAPEIWTQNLPADPGIEPGSSDRPSRSVCNVSRSSEPPRQMFPALSRSAILGQNCAYYSRDFTVCGLWRRCVVLMCNAARPGGRCRRQGGISWSSAWQTVSRSSFCCVVSCTLQSVW